MAVSGGVMSNANVALDAALDELGMLSTITNSRQEYIAEQLSKHGTVDILQHTKNTNKFRRNRVGDMRLLRKMRNKRWLSLCLPSPRSRTRSENESDLPDQSPQCSSSHLSRLSPVPYSALPIDNVVCSNLFKSRSMESVEARASDESVYLLDQEVVSISFASSREVDSVSSGLHRLNVSE